MHLSTSPVLLAFSLALAGVVPDPPEPEPISLRTLPLPPAIADDASPGTCNATSGCTGQSTGFGAGSFLPDGNHVLVGVTYVGGAEGSVFDGFHLLAVKSNGETFASGDPWKCLTCGHELYGDALEYPQSFVGDGKKALWGINIIDCGEYDLVSPECDQDALNIYPIRCSTSSDDAGEGAAIRELRLHPDNVHLAFNSFTTSGASLGQVAYFSRLEFNPSPESGLPLVPRYDLINVTALVDVNAPPSLEVVGDGLKINYNTLIVGELRGFTGDGNEIFYIGPPVESSNIDLFAVHIETGAVRRVTEHPEYVDPIGSSADGEWIAIEDTRGTNRQMWLSGMRHVPPITDLLTASATSSTRNNGQRRFFRPILLDRWGDRGDYFGQVLNDQGSGVAGSGDFNDPEWNARADPRWSPDGTEIVWWDVQTLSPACDGDNPLPCYASKEPYGRTQRVVVAKLTSRQPSDLVIVDPVQDAIPWGIPYVPGESLPAMDSPEPGVYTLTGHASGYARVEFIQAAGNTDGTVSAINVTYHNFSDDNEFFLSGSESVVSKPASLTLTNLDCYSDLTQMVGDVVNTKKTSQDGFHISIDVLTNIMNANGTLITTLDGKSYYQPANGT